ncbi:MAG: hypothetical protein E5299_00526 [Burkholderia gladioli]|nr:MAG: hypothetical protein E5299_00526 [Burkholderia gladioli]
MEIVEPRVSALDDPIIRAESAAVLSASLCDHGPDATFAQCTLMSFGVVATIGIDDTELWERSVSHAQNWRNQGDERQQLCEIVSDLASEDRGEGNAVCVYKDMMLEIWARVIRGVLASFSSASTAHTDDESTSAYERSKLDGCAQLVEQQSVHPIQHASLLLVVESVPVSCPRTEAQSGWQVVRTDACPEHKQNAVERHSIRYTRPPLGGCSLREAYNRQKKFNRFTPLIVHN